MYINNPQDLVSPITPPQSGGDSQMPDDFMSNNPIEEFVERQQIETIAKTMNTGRQDMMADYQSFVKQKASEAKNRINASKDQMDSAIKGQIEEKIKQVVSEKLAAYDKI